MNKRIIYLGLSLILLAILAAGCGEKANVKDDATKLSRENIQDVLEKDQSITDISWQEDKSQVAFIRTTGDFEAHMYIWKIGEEKEKELKGVKGNLYDIAWSPDSKYITVNEGSSTIAETIIISAQDLKITDKIINTGNQVWAPDSDKIAFAVLNDKEAVIPTEWGETCDLMIYDVKSMQKVIVLAADNDFYYNPLAWNDNGLSYEKNYLDGRKSEKLNYKVNDNKTTDNDYDISAEAYVEKNDKLEIEIKYPCIKNINQNMADKFNSVIKERVDSYKTLYYPDDDEFKQTIFADYGIMRKSKDIISIGFFISLYGEGAAHPNNLMDSVTFDLKTGKELELKDLFEKKSSYKEALNLILKDKVDELDVELLEEYKGIEEEQGFYLTEDKLVVYYQEYVYTPHAYGPLELEVKLDEISALGAVFWSCRPLL